MSADPGPYDVAAIDAVVNPITPEIIEMGPAWRRPLGSGVLTALRHAP